MIADILQKAHRKFAKDTDYPVVGDEEFLIRLDHADDAIDEWESLVDEGYSWPELITSIPFTFAGLGSDSLPVDFRAFIRTFDMQGDEGFNMATLLIGGVEYTEVKAVDGEKMAQQGLSPNVFWNAGGNFRSLPALSGTIDLPYIRKATRFVTGAETTEPEMSNPKFIEDYVTAKIFLDNDDTTLYTSNMNDANGKLTKMKTKCLI
jgi:hypothetical protein